MPTYEYECEHCGHRFERMQAMSAAPLKKCPKCGKSVRRLIGTGAGVLFKGSGTSSRSGTGSCSLETTGRTCCGRDSRCDAPGCER
ncbi:MAG: zinc ribbon domain-containing protein [Phycisphaerae bacterium]|nr:zinc ribbon domain-containing protein [Phycisphaerae bacterium]